MKVSGSVDPAVRAVNEPHQDAVTMNVLRTTLDAESANMDALLEVLPDPHPSKGQHLDTYA